MRIIRIPNSEFSRTFQPIKLLCQNKTKDKTRFKWLKKIGFRNLVYLWNHEVSISFIRIQDFKLRIFTNFKLVCWNKKETIKQDWLKKILISEFGMFVKPWGQHIIYQNSQLFNQSLRQNKDFFKKIGIWKHIREIIWWTYYLSKLTYLRQSTSWFEVLLDNLSTSNWRQAKRQVSRIYMFCIYTMIWI